MLLLSTTLDKIQVVTTGSANIDVHASYVDWDGKVSLPGRKNTNIASATTTDVVLAPGSGVSRSIGLLSVRNTHGSASNGITVQHTDGTTVAILKDFTVNAQEQLFFSDSQGWQRILNNGGIYAVPRNAYSFQVANTSGGTSSATSVMMGFGSTCQITASYANRFYLKAIGTIQYTVSTSGGISIYYGTGTAPANGAAATGSLAIGKYDAYFPLYIPFALSAVISGLTVSTPYWLDLALNTNAGFARAWDVQFVAFEV